MHLCILQPSQDFYSTAETGWVFLIHIQYISRVFLIGGIKKIHLVYTEITLHM